jgi:hypothetical protein
MNVKAIIDWAVANQALLYVVLGLIFALLRTTKWGKANATALNTVAGVVEEAKAGGIKAAVADKAAHLDPHVQQAIADAVATVDADKQTPSGLAVFLRAAIPGASGPPAGKP